MCMLAALRRPVQPCSPAMLPSHPLFACHSHRRRQAARAHVGDRGGHHLGLRPHGRKHGGAEGGEEGEHEEADARRQPEALQSGSNGWQAGGRLSRWASSVGRRPVRAAGGPAAKQLPQAGKQATASLFSSPSPGS